MNARPLSPFRRGRIIRWMVLRGGRPYRWRSRALAGAAIYAFFLLAAPFEHHDLACHLKNPFHCTSCTASQLGADPQALVAPGASALAESGRAIALYVAAESPLLSVHSTGRSPPLVA